MKNIPTVEIREIKQLKDGEWAAYNEDGTLYKKAKTNKELMRKLGYTNY